MQKFIKIGAICVFLSNFVWGESIKEYPAILEGHLIIPSKTFIQPPKDAPSLFKSTGKFYQQNRNDNLGSVQVKSGERVLDFPLPFKNQSVQGLSGIKFIKNNEYYVLTDNGLGNKANSSDSMLYIHHYKFDFKNSEAKHIKSIFFNDKHQRAPFKIVLEGTKERYLSGSDFDLESFQIINGEFWVGDEFGPYLLHFSKDGTLKEVFDVVMEGKKIISPDHHNIKLPNTPNGEIPYFNIKRSKGLEGMASSKDEKFLYLMLEGSLFDNGDYESQNGRSVLRIIEFNTKNKEFTNNTYKYFLEKPTHSIGDFNMIDEQYGLIIERDDTEGTKDKACKVGEKPTHCFDNVATFKRIYKVRLNKNSKIAEKVAFIDLMKINDKNKISKKPLVDNYFVFPFHTIENVDIIDTSHIVVANDNNFPFSASRDPNITDDNEIILLEVSDFLKAK